MDWSRAALFVLPTSFVLLGTPTPLSAQLCRVTGAGADYAFECSDITRCANDAACADPPELEATCVPGLGCQPRCASLLRCDADDDCPMIGGCIHVVDASGAPLGLGFCEMDMLFCRFPDQPNTTTEEDFVACMTLPHSDTRAASWHDGDCDRDGCPNANDLGPCDPASTECTFEPTVGQTCDVRLLGSDPEACVIRSDELFCATAHSCERGAGDCPTGFVCRSGACEPLNCGTVYSCRDATDCEGTSLGAATCVRSPGFFASGIDGFCAFDSFRLTSACLDLPGECSTTPFGRPTLDFFQGDCDGDGCPNGSDPTVCESGYTECPEGVSLACGDVLEVPTLDGGVPLVDGGVPNLDGSVRMDAGVVDAPAPPQVSFAGGGGVRCNAGHAPFSRFSLSLGLVLALALWRRRS